MPDSDSPVETVIETVAAYEEVQPADLPTLALSVDTATLTKLTTGWNDQTEPIEFTYVWYEVTIDPTGKVTVTP